MNKTLLFCIKLYEFSLYSYFSNASCKISLLRSNGIQVLPGRIKEVAVQKKKNINTKEILGLFPIFVGGGTDRHDLFRQTDRQMGGQTDGQS